MMNTKSLIKTLTLLIVSAFFLSCSNAGTANSEGKSGQSAVKDQQEEKKQVAKNIPPKSFKAKLESGKFTLLDVRTQQEYQAGHIKDSKHINVLEAQFKEKVSELDKSKPVLVYCKSGGRSSRAMEQMKEMGFDEVYNLEGGITSWMDKGYPTEK